MNVPDMHEQHGASYTDRGGRRAVAHYGRPERTHRAVRRGVGVIDHAVDVVTVTGADRRGFVDDAISNALPAADAGTYAFLLDPQGAVRTDMYAFATAERVLLVLPAGQGEPLAADWAEKVFIQDVSVTDATDEFAVFGVHGPQATEKLASVFVEAAPDEPLTFARGGMGDAGVTAIRLDAPTGEEGYLVVCAAADAREVFDTLETRGLNAVPFGHRVWETLTLEAGTPLLATELAGEIPNVAGARAGLDFEKGCYVGQEVVSRVENRGRPSRRLVGLIPERVPDRGAAVFDGDEAVGEVTRAANSPTRGEPIAMAYVGNDALGADPDERGSFTVRVDGDPVTTDVTDLPFVEGSERSARVPVY